jgi:hypothetical protein
MNSFSGVFLFFSFVGLGGGGGGGGWRLLCIKKLAIFFSQKIRKISQIYTRKDFFPQGRKYELFGLKQLVGRKFRTFQGVIN